MEIMPNQRVMTVKMTRHDFIDVMIAVTDVMISVSDIDKPHWEMLLERLNEQLDQWDEKNGIREVTK